MRLQKIYIETVRSSRSSVVAASPWEPRTWSKTTQGFFFFFYLDFSTSTRASMSGFRVLLWMGSIENSSGAYRAPCLVLLAVPLNGPYCYWNRIFQASSELWRMQCVFWVAINLSPSVNGKLHNRDTGEREEIFRWSEPAFYDLVTDSLRHDWKAGSKKLLIEMPEERMVIVISAHGEYNGSILLSSAQHGEVTNV